MEEKCYLIRLIVYYAMLVLASPREIYKELEGIQSTLIYRNKNNLAVMTCLINFILLNRVEYQELATYYMGFNSKNEELLATILLNVGPQMCRKCILSVQKWWILLNKHVLDHLSNKQMVQGDKKENFHMNDGENVKIKNALGVIII